MTLLSRLDAWKDREAITREQHALLTGLVGDEPFSLFHELNVLLYAGVLAFVLGLGWTVTTFSQRIGVVLVTAVLSAIVAGSLWYCASRAAAWSPVATPSPTFLFDYILYLCCLVWALELAWLEQRLYLLAGHWDLYLLATTVFFFALAYRFDNRFVLSLGLSSLAGWFGFTLARFPFTVPATYRHSALLFCLVVMAGATSLRLARLKPHFFATYLNLVTNVLFIALLSGVFDSGHRTLWTLALLVTAAGSLTWGIRQRQFSFVVYASIYTYISVASLLLTGARDVVGTLFLLVVAAVAVLVVLVVISRRFARTA